MLVFNSLLITPSGICISSLSIPFFFLVTFNVPPSYARQQAHNLGLDINGSRSSSFPAGRLMRRFAYLGNHSDSDALCFTSGYGISTFLAYSGYLVNARWT